MKLGAAIAVALGAGACQPVDGLTADDRPVVITAMLIADTPSQTISILWAPTRDLPTPLGGPSVAEVQLWIVTSATDSIPVTSTGVSGRYTVAVTPRSDVTYRLSGTVRGVAVSAMTTVPGVKITSPHQGDTLRPPIGTTGVTILNFPVFLAATSRGAAAFQRIGVSGQDPTQFAWDLVANPFYFPPDADLSERSTVALHVTVTAVDQNAATFFGVLGLFTPVSGGTTTSTIHGALGVFGSAATASVDVVAAR